MDEGGGVEVFVHYDSEVPVHHGYYDGEIEHGRSSAELSVYEDGYNGKSNLSDLNTSGYSAECEGGNSSDECSLYREENGCQVEGYEGGNYSCHGEPSIACAGEEQGGEAGNILEQAHGSPSIALFGQPLTFFRNYKWMTRAYVL